MPCLLVPTIILTHRKFLAHPQLPLITPAITQSPRRKRLMSLPRHGAFMNLNPTKNFLLVIAILTGPFSTATLSGRHVPMAGELAKTTPLAHVATIASLLRNLFSPATHHRLKSTLLNPLPVLPVPTSAAIGLSCSAYAECVIPPIYLSALTRGWTPLLMVCLVPLPPREHQAHRRDDSLLDRFTRGGRGDTSPTSPVEPYVYVEDRTKELPPTPDDSAVYRYPDGPSS